MKRSEFIRMCALFGIGAPLWNGCNLINHTMKNGKGIMKAGEKVIIIGAGAAGLSAAYLLVRQDVDVIILEASTTYGGRMEVTKDFTDFTIPLGAEWIHTKAPVLDAIVADPSIKVDVKTTPYDAKVDQAIEASGNPIRFKETGFSDGDLRFLNSSWIDFFETYIIPSITHSIQYNQVVKTIDYSEDQIKVKTAQETFIANRVIVTVPVSILKAGDLTFTPRLDSEKQEAISNLKLHDGCKGFIAFKERFYPTVIKIDEGEDGPRLYYDGAYKQNTQDHILGFAAIGEMSKPYLALKDPERIQFMLKELDEIFDGQASKNYIKHVFKDWSSDPFAKGVYNSGTNIGTILKSVSAMSIPVNNKLFFAGDLYTNGKNGWSMVHVAAESAKRVVQTLMG